MKVNENIRKEREAILRARREDIRRRKAERERNERAEVIKAEQERIESEKERIEKEKMRKYIKKIEEKQRIEAEEKERKERRQQIVDRIGVTLGTIVIVVGIIVTNVQLFDSFAEFFYFLKVIAVLIGVMIAFGIVGLIGVLFGLGDSSSIHYTTPHHYVVTDENKDEYRVYREKDTTTFVAKR